MDIADRAVNQAASSAAGGVTGDRVSPDSGNGTHSFSQFISFAIGDDQYGVDIMSVREIKGWSQITPLPRQPDYMRGVLNLRGIMRSSTCAAASARAGPRRHRSIS